MLKYIGIRTRIVGGSLVIAILISIAAGIVINSQLERIVREGTSAVLHADTAPYVAALQDDPTDELDSPGPSQLVAVVAPDGTIPMNTLPDSLSEMIPQLTELEKTTNVNADGTEYVVLATPVIVGSETWTVIAARNSEAETTVLAQMQLLLIIALATICAATALAAWLLTTASLAPVKRLRTSAEELSESSLTELLPVGEANDEISALARTLNELIERLRASAVRERQLVSDASHELRTPLALLNMQLQVALAESPSAEQLTADVRAAQRNVARMSALVTSMLELSELEAINHDGHASALELEREAAEAAGRARFRAAGTGVDVTYKGLGAAARDESVFALQAEDFGRVVDNLVTNSLRAMPEAGRLDISLTRSDDGLVLSVTDTGGGLDPEFEPIAFDRFTRADRARAAGSGSGLGLSIVAAIVNNTGGEIRLDNRPGDGLTVIVELKVDDPDGVEGARSTSLPT